MDDATVVLGRDVKWKAIEGEALRIRNFTPLAMLEDGRVRSSSVNLPYGILSVEAPILPGNAQLWVVNRVDFATLWSAFKERGLKDNEEAIVCCVPFYRHGLLRALSSMMPRLHVFIFPRGHLEEVYDPSFKTDDPHWLRPIARFDPTAYK